MNGAAIASLQRACRHGWRISLDSNGRVLLRRPWRGGTVLAVDKATGKVRVLYRGVAKQGI